MIELWITVVERQRHFHKKKIFYNFIMDTLEIDTKVWYQNKNNNWIKAIIVNQLDNETVIKLEDNTTLTIPNKNIEPRNLFTL